jgi:hypothetical protein
MLFGVAGLISEKNGYDSETEQYLEQLHSFWEMLKPSLDTTPMPSEAWQFFRLRPANFPTRRIAALSHLVLNYTVQPVFTHYLELFSFYASHPGQEAKQIRLFERTLELPITGYWQSRYRFGPPAKSAHDKRFLGTSRIRDILISAVFPAYLCYASYTGYTELESQILQLYRRFPSPSWDQGTKTLAAQILAGQDVPARKLKTAVIYQGLLQLAKTSCALPTCEDCLLMSKED